MLIRSTSIILVLLLFWSCEEVVDLDVDFNPGVVVVSEIAPNREIKVNLSRSRPILSQLSTEYVVASEVTILNRRNGQIIELFLEKDTVNPNSNSVPFYLSDQSNLISASNNYELNVKVEGEEPISAITTIPGRVNIQSLNLLDFSENVDPRIDNQFKINFDLSFNHNARIAGNYHLVFYFRHVEPVEIESDTVYFYVIQAPVVEDLTVSFPYTFDFENGVLIQGEDISEGSHSFKAELSVNFDSNLSPFPPELFVELRNTNTDYHDYHFNLSRQRSQRDSIISQAILIPSNINNGLGIFSGYNFDIQSVLLQE